MFVIMKSWFSQQLCDSLPNAFFLYGDNDRAAGTAGQASIRNCPNAIGIPTKKLPSMNEGSFYTDEEFDSNIAKIGKELAHVEDLLSRKYVVFYPADGVGTGMAQLNIHAPRTFAWLNAQVGRLLKQYPSLPPKEVKRND